MSVIQEFGSMRHEDNWEPWPSWATVWDPTSKSKAVSGVQNVSNLCRTPGRAQSWRRDGGNIEKGSTDQ